jgi:hypothetical protein
MKISFTLLLTLFIATLLSAQISILEQGANIDSSYYDIYKVAKNEIWLGGEYGILKRIVSDNKIEQIPIPNNGANILKIIREGNYVYIAADRGTIYKYNLETKQCIRKEFPTYEKKCFYDIAIDNDGNLLVCGGNSRIARGKKAIPNGFIATIDSSLNFTPNVIWNNKRKFVWALIKDKNNTINAAVFNGVNSAIYCLNNENKNWNKNYKIKGLIHGLSEVNGEIYYAGSASINYQKSGIWGKINSSEEHHKIENSGLICNIFSTQSFVYGLTQQGKLLQLNNNELICESDFKYPFYEAILGNEDTVYLVGHGKLIYQVKLKL